MSEEELDGGQQPEPTGEPVIDGAEPTEVQEVALGELKVPLKDARDAWQNYQNGMKWQAKLTQKSQELKETEGKLQKARALEDFLSQHPEAYGEVEQILKKANKPSEGGVPQELSGVMERIKAAEMTVTTRAEEIRLQNELSDLKRKHTEMFTEDPELEMKIVRCALDNKIGNLDLAFKIVTHDALLERGIKQGLDKAKNARLKSYALGNAAPGGKPDAKSIRDSLKGKGFDSPEMHEALLNHPALRDYAEE